MKLVCARRLTAQNSKVKLSQLVTYSCDLSQKILFLIHSNLAYKKIARFFDSFACCAHEARNALPVAKLFSPSSIMKDFLSSLLLPLFF